MIACRNEMDALPIYIKIYREIKDQITKYKYLPNEKLPSENELKDYYKVSRQTIQNAFQMLVNEGLVTRRQGKASYVSPLTTHPPLQVLHLGGINEPGVPITRYHYIFAQRVMELSSGRLTIQIHHSSETGNGATQVQHVQWGTQDMFGAAVEWLELVDPAWSITTYPFLFKNLKELQTLVDSPMNQTMKEKLVRQHGIRLLADNWYRPSRVFISRRPCFSLEDLKNLRMAVSGIPLYRDLWSSFDMEPVPCQWGTETLAFQQDHIDAMDAPLDAILEAGLYRYAPYLLKTDHLFSRACIIVNETKFQMLRSDLQEILIRAAEEIGKLYSDHVLQNMKNMENSFIDRGGVIIRINTDAFSKRVDAVFSRKIQNKYPDVYEAYLKIRQTQTDSAAQIGPSFQILS